MYKIILDMHTHSDPSIIPVHLGLGAYHGISQEKLEAVLRRKEAKNPGVRYGAAYGPHNLELLHKSPNTEYLAQRTLPMLENHPLQTVCVNSWDRVGFLETVQSYKDQVALIKAVAKNGGISLIDIPEMRASPSEGKDRIFTGFRGQATVEQLQDLPSEVKARTFLCWNSILPPHWRWAIDEMSELTGLRILGGSDAMICANSLFSAYSEATVENIADVLDDPSLLGNTHRGNSPWVFGERLLRYATALAEIAIHTNPSREDLANRQVREWRWANLERDLD